MIDYVILVAITFASAIILTFILRKLLNAFVDKYSKRLKADPTNFSFIKNSLSTLIFSSAIIFIFFHIPYLKDLGAALFAGAGVFAAIIGFASQKAFANIISGIFILIFKPFRVGDTVQSQNIEKGVVEEITLRHTIIRNYELRRVVIPNSTISEETLINSDLIEKIIRKHVEFGISYDSPVDRAIEIIQEEAMKHPLLIDNRSEEAKEANEHPVLVRMVSHGDFSIGLKAYVHADSNDNAFIIHTDLLKSVKERFDAEGIEIPFPYRTIVYKKDINP
jgi:small conductance mechanosensitive channel